MISDLSMFNPLYHVNVDFYTNLKFFYLYRFELQYQTYVFSSWKERSCFAKSDVSDVWCQSWLTFFEVWCQSRMTFSDDSLALLFFIFFIGQNKIFCWTCVIICFLWMNLFWILPISFHVIGLFFSISTFSYILFSDVYQKWIFFRFFSSFRFSSFVCCVCKLTVLSIVTFSFFFSFLRTSSVLAWFFWWRLLFPF